MTINVYKRVKECATTNAHHVLELVKEAVNMFVIMDAQTTQ